jgi:Ca2+-binding RTX toxin-like protein
MRNRVTKIAGVLAVVVASVGMAVLFIGGASAASPCANSLAKANTLTTVSADGETVHGSSCSDRIIVTSPLVTEVVAGGGNDVIYASPDVEVVEAGAGDDVIYGDGLEKGEESGAIADGPIYQPLSRRSGSSLATISLQEKKCEAGVSCYGGDKSQRLIGSSGNDKIFGQRGDDLLEGNEGNDQLFGGVGDEVASEGGGIKGGPGNDLLSGGLGIDTIDGEAGSDLVLGDGTTDEIKDTGASGTDTLSFSTGITPGFEGEVAVEGFPADEAKEERGVNVHLDGTQCSGEYEACDNNARYGGGLDNITASGFENVIGSPFADYIVGSSGANRIDGGGGADVIYGKGGDDELHGGADGDYLNAEEGNDTIYGEAGKDSCISENSKECETLLGGVTQRDRSKISVGYMEPQVPESMSWVSLYLTGSKENDHVKASYSGGTVTFTTEAGSAQFDTSENGAAGCTYEATKVTCSSAKSLNAITVAGMAGNDILTLEGFPETTTPIMLGGEGNDELVAPAGATEDMLVDGNGSGNDVLLAKARDDALIANEGADVLQGGLGNDLLLSASICDGDTLQGAASGEGDGEGVNNASWAKLPEGGVVADLEKTAGTPANGLAGNSLPEARKPACTTGTVSTLLNIDDLEGSQGEDKFYGDEKENHLLGHKGKDEFWARGGDDTISAVDELIETGGAGAGTDECFHDPGESFSSCEK